MRLSTPIIAAAIATSAQAQAPHPAIPDALQPQAMICVGEAAQICPGV